MRRKEQLQELRERSLPELEQELTETRQTLFQNRIRYATRNLDNPGPLRAGKKRIARILTLLREAETPAAAGTARKKNGKRNR
jgi:large subunit ribosomal protein L29